MAATIDAALAVTEDLATLTGVGVLVTKGTRGARLATKLARGSTALLEDRVLKDLLPNFNSVRSVSKWASGKIVSTGWMFSANAMKDEQFDLWAEVLAFIPIVNAGLSLRTTVKYCFL